MRRLGDEWQEGRRAVWEEHLMAAAIRSSVEALYPRVLERKSQVQPVPVTVAFFCPPEETHDLGLRMLADLFDLRGFHTVFVGAMTPFEQMIDCAHRVGADVVCLSASTHFQRAVLRSGVDRLRSELSGVHIVVGGPAFVHSSEGWEENLVTSLGAFLDRLEAEARLAGGSGGGDTGRGGNAVRTGGDGDAARRGEAGGPGDGGDAPRA